MIFRQIPTWTFFAALAIMIVGAFLALYERHNHRHTHEALEHEHRHSHDDGHHEHTHKQLVVGEHSHIHIHDDLTHSHIHTPDLHHTHKH